MRGMVIVRTLRALVSAVGIVTILGASSASWAVVGDPDFDGVGWIPMQCQAGGDPQNDENPGSTDLVGNAAFPAVFVGLDAGYLYFRFRMDSDPSGPKGFDQASWTALMQVPSGNPFQHQFQLSLNGSGADDDFGNIKGDTIEIWANTAASDIDFSPLFNDPSEVRLFSQRYDFSGAEHSEHRSPGPPCPHR